MAEIRRRRILRQRFTHSWASLWPGFHPEGFPFCLSDKPYILFPSRAKPTSERMYGPRFKSRLPFPACISGSTVCSFLEPTSPRRGSRAPRWSGRLPGRREDAGEPALCGQPPLMLGRLLWSPLPRALLLFSPLISFLFPLPLYKCGRFLDFGQSVGSNLCGFSPSPFVSRTAACSPGTGGMEWV